MASQERTPPTPLRLSTYSLPSNVLDTADEQSAWSVEMCAAVFIESVIAILDKRPSEVGSLTFDKDDEDALSFVTAASNLRATIFGIERQSRWKVKEVAGNIIAAIATTNAIIAGFIVLQALKVLSGKEEACRLCYCNRLPSGRKRDKLLEGSQLDPPEPRCYVCGKSSRSLTLDTTTWTVGMLIDTIVKKELSFNRPTIDASTLGDTASDQLCEGADEGTG